MPQAPTPAPQGPPSVAAAQALANAGKPADARAMLERLSVAEPENFRVWSALSSVCRRLNDSDCAIAASLRALKIRAGDPQTLINMGLAYAGKGDLDAAFDWWGRARATRRVDMTQLFGTPAPTVAVVDPRMTALMPVADDFEDPFVEPTKIIQEFRGEAANDQFGWIARSIGDVDGDAVADFTTSAPSHANGAAPAGRVYVFSSKRGRLLWKADGNAGDSLGIGIEAAGDVNGDGAGDVIASAPGGAYAKVYSGKDGAELLTFKDPVPTEGFGRHASGMADINGDHVPDLIVGAPGNPGAPAEYPGRAYVYSGKDGALLHTFKGERGGDGFGSAVTGSFRNGQPIIVIGAASGGPNHTGRVYVYTGLADTPAFTVDSDATGIAMGGMFVSVPGDLDGDGAEDVYISDWSNAAKGPSTGRTYIHSGKTGKSLFVFTGEHDGDGLGTTQAIAGDIDGDGTPDLAIGAWQYGGAAVGGGRMYLYSGKTGALLKTITCRTPGDTFGFDGVGIGDVDADGSIDLLVTSAWSAVNGFHSGRIFIVSSGIQRRHAESHSIE